VTDPGEGIGATATVRIPSRALVVLVGPSGVGKSTWARRWFRPDQVLSSDAMRAMVGWGEHDRRAGTDAFEVLGDVLDRRMRRGLLTVVDTLGLDPDRRATWLAIAHRHSRPTVAVRFDGEEREIRRRNRSRADAVPAAALTSQLRVWEDATARLDAEFDLVVGPGRPHVVPAHLVAPGATAGPAGTRLRFGLHLSSFTWQGGDADVAATLARIARDAEAAGFASLWVMDHMVQIPQVGREWEPMPEAYTTLGYLAACTERVRLGTLVTGVTLRSLPLVGKLVATLDVLSSGRAVCGLGAAWHEREHRRYGLAFPSLRERYELLEDALRLLPLMWGPGSPSFEGHHTSVTEATCYPRPLQENVPILVGGSGERRTLRLAARYADACNLFGEPGVVARKVEVLRRHCADVDRDPAEVAVTQLSTVLCGPDPAAVESRLAQLTPRGVPVEEVGERLTAGTAADHTARFAALAEAGVDEVVVRLADVDRPDAVERFAPVVGAFSR
jgi:F420-dependent oxidoreductase-like protein